MPQLIAEFHYDLDKLSSEHIDSSSSKFFLSHLNTLHRMGQKTDVFDPKVDFQLVITSIQLEEWLQDDLEEFKDNNPSHDECLKHIEEVAGVLLHELEGEEVIGILGVQKFHSSTLKGVQIRQAYIRKAFRKHRLMQEAYCYLVEKFGSVFSDNLQTPAAAAMWQNAFPRFGIVTAYDLENNEYLCDVSPSESLSKKLWSITPIDKSKKETYIRAKDNYNLGSVIDIENSKFHTVLKLETK
ncbi:hypothetical protein C1E23_01765 [Pseudoalteromonas phenolica]|uniref:Uncharacterized protein n=1 Tax=Pseudoalteromonas phenolica TaxID=161398 RepID=A0A4Q7IS24_9GAMM|nr:hypothetical protein [Pseudoalteromonas phenolica]RZQ54850.1 hypothetical protein C1E23_01765 [Pseudoalteromonas phenolica]